MKMTLILGAVAALSLSACMKKAGPANNEPAAGGEGKVVMASADAGAGCHGKVEMASATEGEGAHHCATKATMADGAHCKTKGAEMAHADMDCKDCPKTADGKCDHEAGAKAGKDCCKKALEAKAPTATDTKTN